MARLSTRLRALAWTLGCGVIATGAVGALHLPAARPLLARFGVACPSRALTPEQVQAAREPALSRLRGGSEAPRRPALGLSLDGTTESQASAWALQRGLRCETSARGLRFLRCRDVPELAVSGRGAGVVADLTLTFGPEGRLIGVDALRTRLAAADAGGLHDHLAAALEHALGRPTESAPGFVRYRFADYLASVTTLTLPSGPAVREQYLSIRIPQTT